MCALTSFVCVCAQLLSHVWLFATLQTVACQAPLPLGFPKKEYWSELPFPDSGDLPDSGFEPMSLASSWLKVWTHVSCISHTGRQILYHCATWKAQAPFSNILKKKKKPRTPDIWGTLLIQRSKSKVHNQMEETQETEIMRGIEEKCT